MGESEEGLDLPPIGAGVSALLAGCFFGSAAAHLFAGILEEGVHESGVRGLGGGWLPLGLAFGLTLQGAAGAAVGLGLWRRRRWVLKALLPAAVLAGLQVVPAFLEGSWPTAVLLGIYAGGAAWLWRRKDFQGAIAEAQLGDEIVEKE